MSVYQSCYTNSWTGLSSSAFQHITYTQQLICTTHARWKEGEKKKKKTDIGKELYTSGAAGEILQAPLQQKTLLLVFAGGQKMTRENKDEWSHWLQIQASESTARVLSIAIYYIHVCDLWGVRRGWRGRWQAPTCSAQLLAAWRSNSPPLLATVLLILEDADTLSPPPPVCAINRRKWSDGVWQGGRLNKDFSSSRTVQRWRWN